MTELYDLFNNFYIKGYSLKERFSQTPYMPLLYNKAFAQPDTNSLVTNMINPEIALKHFIDTKITNDVKKILLTGKYTNDRKRKLTFLNKIYYSTITPNYLKERISNDIDILMKRMDFRNLIKLKTNIEKNTGKGRENKNKQENI